MRNDKIIAAWDKMNPDSDTSEKILQQIQDTMNTGKKCHFLKQFRRFALGFAAAVVFMLGSLGTAYAASPAFREYVRSLLFPLYTPEAMISIGNGHMTGSFDRTDVLLSFLDKFNRKEFGNSVTAAKENGYHYNLFVQNDNQLLAFADSNMEGYCIVVYMERIAYESTEGIWQVTGYQILKNSDAENMKHQLEPYSDDTAEDISLPREENPPSFGGESSLTDCNVTINDISLSLSESRQSILTKLEAAGLDYSEVKPDSPDDVKYDLYYNTVGSLQIYFLDDNCVRIRLIKSDSDAAYNAQTARGLHAGDTYSQMTELYGNSFETHTYAIREIYTIYRYSTDGCICEFGIWIDNSYPIYNIDIYLPSQSPIYEYGEEIPKTSS